jgi:uncharacterized membrane protein YcaP (DUF421 family)
MFTLGTEWWDIILRSTVVYIAVLLGLRYVGRQTLGQRSALDVVLILIVANAVQNAMIGPDTSLIGGLIAAATLFTVDRVLGAWFRRHRKIKGFFEGGPVILIQDGQVLQANMAKERIDQDELQETLEEHGVEHVSQVKLGILEMDGSLSIIPADAPSSRTDRKLGRHRVAP